MSTVSQADFDAAVARITALEAAPSGSADLNTFYLLWAGALIFLMQAGFATLSAGSIRQKNVKNILLKNLLDACMGAITWYFVGYGFAYDGEPSKANGCIGRNGKMFA